MAMVDVFKLINSLAQMRSSQRSHKRSGSVLLWRWFAADGGYLPKHLSTKQAEHVHDVRWNGLADIVILPGWQAHTGPQLNQCIQNAQSSFARITRVHALGGSVVAVQDGVAFVGACGLLSGRQAVAPWTMAASVLRHSHGVKLVTELAWMAHERIWSCDSTILATELILDCLKHTLSSELTELAVTATHAMLHSPERQKVSVQIVQDALRKPVPMGALQRVRRYLEDKLTLPYDVKLIALAANTSERSLLRHYNVVYQQSPLQYLHSLRVARAKVLLETTYLPVDQVALACGYPQVGTFRRIFTSATGKPPAAYRERYRLRTSRKRWETAASLIA